MVETIFRTRKPMLLLTKTTCFTVVMDNGAFVGGVTSVRNRV